MLRSCPSYTSFWEQIETQYHLTGLCEIDSFKVSDQTTSFRNALCMNYRLLTMFETSQHSRFSSGLESDANISLEQLMFGMTSTGRYSICCVNGQILYRRSSDITACRRNLIPKGNSWYHDQIKTWPNISWRASVGQLINHRDTLSGSHHVYSGHLGQAIQRHQLRVRGYFAKQGRLAV